MSNIQRCRKGDLVEIAFLDHAEGTDYFSFVTWGKVVSQSRAAVVVLAWGYDGERASEEIDAHDQSIIVHTILKSAITRLVLLKRSFGK